MIQKDTLSTEEKQEEKFVDAPQNPYDPFQAAVSRGRVLGKGLSGQYRRTPITVFGFVMVGFVFVATGLAVGFSPFYKGGGFGDDFVFDAFSVVLGVVMFFMGGALFLRVFKNND